MANDPDALRRYTQSFEYDEAAGMSPLRSARLLSTVAEGIVAISAFQAAAATGDVEGGTDAVVDITRGALVASIPVNPAIGIGVGSPVCGPNRPNRSEPVTYLKVVWIHSIKSEPILLFSEISEHREEIRKVEVYADGRYDYADDSGATGSTMLSEMPLPSIEDIGSDPQFEPSQIEQAEFERAWHEALRQHRTC